MRARKGTIHWCIAAILMALLAGCGSTTHTTNESSIAVGSNTSQPQPTAAEQRIMEREHAAFVRKEKKEAKIRAHKAKLAQIAAHKKAAAEARQHKKEEREEQHRQADEERAKKTAERREKHEYPAEEQEIYLNGCRAQGDFNSVCHCELAKLEARDTIQEVHALGSIMKSGGETPAYIEQIAEECLRRGP